MGKAGGRERARGGIDVLPSGGHRVRVYAGVDPLTGKRNYLTEVVPPGPGAAREAEKTRTRLLSQVDERRNPRTKATLNQLLDRYLEIVELEHSTRRTYEGYLDRHVRPVLGPLPLGRVDGEVLDSFYAQLRRCRLRCNRRQRLVDHRVTREHECVERCRPHQCKPLSPSTVRQIHWILSGAFERAVRWKWIAVSPTDAAEPPAQPKPKPSPPSPAEAARIINEAWKDPAWGTFVWLAMVTGPRRGELCGLRRRHYDRDARILRVHRSVAGGRSDLREKDTKTHQERRVALDAETIAILNEHLARQDAEARELGLTIDDSAFLFSLDPDCGTPLIPGSVTQRYDRLAERLGIQTTLHKLRHYNATELIAAGVDLRTVAGRLGHGGGGTTTLRFYAAWVSEADQRAADSVAARLPRRPPQQ
jgi:integrase